ncbi:MAG: HD-GYP domain-containing protein [Acidimicrobiia bacterium]|nr:HD-GYP domain-containing protein [Acidimicrobiia bacterium]
MDRFHRLLLAVDPDLAAHGKRAGRLARDIAEKMRLEPDRIEGLEAAAHLHDIGKIFISRQILDKPGPLDAAEWEELRQHPMTGYQLIRDSVPEVVAQVVLTHHERFDGTGYPHGVQGSRIPLEARILQVADAFDAITSERPYQPSLPVEYALNEMVRWSGTQFDPSVVEATVALAGRAQWVTRQFGTRIDVLDGIAV